jgi:hypothetical protein
MNIRSSGCAFYLAVSLACGCSSGDQTPPQDAVKADLGSLGGDLSVGDLAMTGACNSLVNAASLVQQTMVNQPMPSATMGGTIQPGTYHLTDSKIYQGAPPGVVPLKLQVTQLISGSSVQAVQRTGSSADTYTTSTYNSSGTTLSVTIVCGGAGMGNLGYDATGTQYTTYNDAAKTVNVWTRQ